MDLDNRLNNMANDFWELIKKGALVYEGNKHLTKFENNSEKFKLL